MLVILSALVHPPNLHSPNTWELTNRDVLSIAANTLQEAWNVHLVDELRLAKAQGGDTTQLFMVRFQKELGSLGVMLYKVSMLLLRPWLAVCVSWAHERLVWHSDTGKPVARSTLNYLFSESTTNFCVIRSSLHQLHLRSSSLEINLFSFVIEVVLCDTSHSATVAQLPKSSIMELP